MFSALKEKLRSFKKKAKDDLEQERAAGPVKVNEQDTRARKESKFLGKIFSKKTKKDGIDQNAGPASDGHIEVKEAGAFALQGRDSLIEEGGGIFAKKITQDKLEDIMFDLEMALLESDVAQGVVERIKNYIIKELEGAKVKRSSELEDVIEGALKKAIRQVLDIKSIDLIDSIRASEKPYVVMFVGVNGTGKTTAIGRIAHRLQREGISCVLAAGDTFRAGAIEQLTKHAENLGLKIIKHSAGADPAAVAYDAIEHAKARKKDVVLLDTAGRMQTNINLMDEMKKIRRIARPNLIVFVGDALAGNDAVIQASEFDKAVGVDGAILTKIDADAKGGAALSIAYTIGKPILYVGTGQGYEDLEPFDANWMIERLFEE
ncbi:MAG: signal recognition particle-docking protein FtsY [Candidatus Thermoplasmatota archaeon]|nr:signal recognition particle-docking protein FtsY [Candidatus Thermoplasmatota archaeon]